MTAEQAVDALVVGAGPAGLAAAIELRRVGVEKVEVLDRWQVASRGTATTPVTECATCTA